MATFFINSSNQTTIGTPADDQFFIESGVQRIDLQGEAGNDEFQYFFGGGNNSSFNFGNSNVNANGGNDTIRIKLNTGSDILANAFRGGLDNDQILLTAKSGASGASFAGNLLQGGAGNDTIKVKFNSADYNNLTINGNQGVDFISFSASAQVGSRVSNIVIGGGQDNDQIQVDINGTGTRNFAIAGGLGADRLQLQFETGTTNLVVNGGTRGTDDVEDGGDDIFISAARLAGSNSVLGNGGRDNIRFIGNSAEGLLMNGNAGDDTVIISANEFKNVTLAGGAGDDVIEVRQSAGAFSAGRNSLIGGNGDDTIFINTGTLSAGATLTIQGGRGADLFFIASSTDQFEASGISAAGSISGANFSYTSLTDSTIDALDTIVVGSAGQSGTILNMFMPLDVPVSVFNGQAGGFIFTAGVLDMSTGAGSGGGISLNQIVGTLDATLSEGDAVAFRLDTAGTSGFVFVAGAQAGVNDDLLVRIEGFSSASMSAGDATLVNGGANSVILDIA